MMFSWTMRRGICVVDGCAANQVSRYRSPIGPTGSSNSIVLPSGSRAVFRYHRGSPAISPAIATSWRLRVIAQAISWTRFQYGDSNGSMASFLGVRNMVAAWSGAHAPGCRRGPCAPAGPAWRSNRRAAASQHWLLRGHRQRSASSDHSRPATRELSPPGSYACRRSSRPWSSRDLGGAQRSHS